MSEDTDKEERALQSNEMYRAPLPPDIATRFSRVPVAGKETTVVAPEEVTYNPRDVSHMVRSVYPTLPINAQAFIKTETFTFSVAPI